MSDSSSKTEEKNFQMVQFEFYNAVFESQMSDWSSVTQKNSVIIATDLNYCFIDQFKFEFHKVAKTPKPMLICLFPSFSNLNPTKFHNHLDIESVIKWLIKFDFDIIE